MTNPEHEEDALELLSPKEATGLGATVIVIVFVAGFLLMGLVALLALATGHDPSVEIQHFLDDLRTTSKYSS